MRREDENYDDIIGLPHFHAPGKPFMKNSERAAQFAPFKSLGSGNMVVAKDVWEDKYKIELFDEGDCEIIENDML